MLAYLIAAICDSAGGTSPLRCKRPNTKKRAEDELVNVGLAVLADPEAVRGPSSSYEVNLEGASAVAHRNRLAGILPSSSGEREA